jgi:hypothetical protein
MSRQLSQAPSRRKEGASCVEGGMLTSSGAVGTIIAVGSRACKTINRMKR